MAAQENKSQPGVFISYRRSDTSSVAARMKNDLAKALGEDQVFYDVESLKGGVLWRTALEETIKDCSVFLALIGEKWLHERNDESGQRRLDEPDDQVRTEIEFALKVSGSLLIIPVLIDDTKMPKEDYLPPSIQGLPNHHAMPLRTATNPDWNRDMQAIVARMREKGLVPAAEKATDAWLPQHLTDTAKRFVTHMTNSQLRHGAGAASPYIDLFVVKRLLGKKKENIAEDANAGQGYSLEQTIQQAQGPLLLIGEGGSGKTTSLFYLAARAADRAKDDPKSPIPIYISLRLTNVEDMTDLQQLISDSVPQVKDWSELSAFAIRARRRFLFLFDSFNEIPEHLQRTCAATLQRFVVKHASDH
ncbi:MAG TPA: TIR domain-containing protein, partial [Pyrinomonadaceae bacterium]|nr:TIR domain-containing protein [Pyrinomonadaceae bacterium]